jgi:hypothetical protein
MVMVLLLWVGCCAKCQKDFHHSLHDATNSPLHTSVIVDANTQQNFSLLLVELVKTVFSSFYALASSLESLVLFGAVVSSSVQLLSTTS